MNRVSPGEYSAALQLFAAYGRAIDSAAAVDQIVELLADDPVIVAPGNHRFEGSAACRGLLAAVVDRLHRSASSVQHRYSDIHLVAEPTALAASANLLTTTMTSATDILFPELHVVAGDRYELSQRVEARLVRKNEGLVFAEMTMIALWARVERGVVDLRSAMLSRRGDEPVLTGSRARAGLVRARYHRPGRWWALSDRWCRHCGRTLARSPGEVTGGRSLVHRIGGG